MKAIVAMCRNRVIGINDKLPWPPIKEDFKWFKEFTINKTIVIGKKTFDSLPKLKDRNCIVVIKPQPELSHIKNQSFINNNGMISKMMLFEEIINLPNNSELIIAGGAKTYSKFLPYITEFYVTHVNGDYPGNIHMPHFEHLFTNKEVVKEFDLHKVIKYSK
jgi:dihydrofolate reductase